MIRNDLKELLPSNWRSIFSHRTCDPENYEVGVFNINSTEKILVLNPDTLDIMEYFYDDVPDDKWINLDNILTFEHKFTKRSSSGKYYINKLYNIKKSNPNKIYNLFNSKINQGKAYPTKSLYKENIKFYIHRIIALVFVPNPKPDEYKLVNHIDMNYINFKKENLEWVNRKINNSSEKRKERKLTFWYDQIDVITKKVIKSWGYRELRSSNFNMEAILKSIDNKKPYKNFLWKRTDINLELYLEKHPIIENGWYTNKFIKSHKVEANLCGILRINGKLTVGSLNKSGYRKITLTVKGKSKSYPVHRLIYETISGKLIPKGFTVDHIIPITKDDINNEYSNLRVCTQKENMNNEETLKKFYTKISKYNIFGELIEEYQSLKDIKETKIHKNNKSLLNTPEKYGFIWDTDINSVKEKINYIYFKFNEKGKLVGYNKFLKRLTNNSNNALFIKKYYVNTGIKYSDGYYYQQGDPTNFLNTPDNIELIKHRKILEWNKRKRG